MTASVGLGAGRRGGPAGSAPPDAPRHLAVIGAVMAGAVTAAGLVLLTPLIVAGYLAAPHAGANLGGVARALDLIWLAAHHVSFAIRGAGRFGMLPLGLMSLPAGLLALGGAAVARLGRVTRPGHIGYAALALAAPYSAVCGALALAGRSGAVSASVPQALVAGFVLALLAGGLGAARAVTRWSDLVAALTPRARAVGVAGITALAIMLAGGTLLTTASLASHWAEFRALTSALAPGGVGGALLYLGQAAYLPNAAIWSVCYCLGPGFAFGAHTAVAPTGSVLGPMPVLPLLAALPSSAGAIPGWVSALTLVLPYLAGAVGGWLVTRSRPAPALETVPLWGFLAGAMAGLVMGVLAALSGGPMGGGRLTEVGPSGWQTGLVAMLEVGIAAAVSAGFLTWAKRRSAAAGPRVTVPRSRGPVRDAAVDESGHRIFVDPWKGARRDPGASRRPGPSSLP